MIEENLQQQVYLCRNKKQEVYTTIILYLSVCIPSVAVFTVIYLVQNINNK